MFRSPHHLLRHLGPLLGQHTIRHFRDHFFQQQAQMTARAVITGGNMFDPVGMSAELVTFAKASTALILSVVDSDRLTAVLANDGEARHVCRAVSQIDHIGKWHAPQVGGHVVIDILMGAGQAFIDAKKVLRLLRVTDDPLGERDPTAVILSKFAAKNRRHVRRET